jgi:hypothetical protein
VQLARKQSLLLRQGHVPQKWQRLCSSAGGTAGQAEAGGFQLDTVRSCSICGGRLQALRKTPGQLASRRSTHLHTAAASPLGSRAAGSAAGRRRLASVARCRPTGRGRWRRPASCCRGLLLRWATIRWPACWPRCCCCSTGCRRVVVPAGWVFPCRPCCRRWPRTAWLSFGATCSRAQSNKGANQRAGTGGGV